MATALPSESVTDLLQNLPLFAGLPDAALAALAGQSRVDAFERDDVIFYQGDPCDRVWLLRIGQVKIVHQEADGREVILEMIAPGEPFGGAVVFLPQHPATAKAMEPCETVSLANEAYARFITGYPAVALKLLRLLGGRLHSMMSLNVLAGERVERRMAHILLKLADRVGCPDTEGTLIPISLARQDLADMSGTTLETAIRTMSRFRADGIIKTRRGGYLVITNEAALQQLARKEAA